MVRKARDPATFVFIFQKLGFYPISERSRTRVRTLIPFFSSSMIPTPQTNPLSLAIDFLSQNETLSLKTDRIQDLEISTVLRWAVVCEEVRRRIAMSTWEGEERVAGGNGGERAATGGNGLESGSAEATMGGAVATGGASDGVETPSGGAGSSGHTPLTPTVEELLKAAEDGAGHSGEAAAASETVTVGRFAATPILRSSMVEPRGGDRYRGF